MTSQYKNHQYLSVKKFNSMIINLHNKNDYNAKNAITCENQLVADSILQKHYNIKDFSTFMSITSFDRNNTALKAFCFLKKE